MRWLEYWYSREPDDEAVDTGPKRIFKQIKSNYPKTAPPKALMVFLQALHDDLFHAPLNVVHPNLPVLEHQAIEQLIKGMVQ